jgi:hypothetical protein
VAFFFEPTIELIRESENMGSGARAQTMDGEAEVALPALACPYAIAEMGRDRLPRMKDTTFVHKSPPVEGKNVTLL